MSDELSQLKERADQLGLKYKPNIGVESLKARVAAALAGDGEAESEEDMALIQKTEPRAPKAENEQQLRDRLLSEATALVRCRITCLNPSKAHSKGEVITVGNKFTGAISKYISYGEDTDNGYHVPKILFDELKSRKFNSLRSEKGANGVFHPVQRLVNEFAIEVLEPLTPTELEQLARNQAAAAGL